MERLGHSSVTVSLDRYGHLLPGLDEALTEGLEATFRDSRATSVQPQRASEVVSLPQVRAENML